MNVYISHLFMHFFQFVNFNLAHKCICIIHLYTDVYIGARCLNFSLCILLSPQFLYAISKGALTRLCVCTGSYEATLLADRIKPQISYAGPFKLHDISRLTWDTFISDPCIYDIELIDYAFRYFSYYTIVLK